MAGDWIPMRFDLSDDPAVIAMASALRSDTYAVIGRLHKLWVWANRHLSCGHTASISESWIDNYVSKKGFAVAMISASWLEKTDAGIVFPNFERWNSKGAKARLMESGRQRKHRDRKGEIPAKCHAPTVTENGDVSRPERDENVTRPSIREEKSIEEKKKETPPSPLPGEQEELIVRLRESIVEVSGVTTQEKQVERVVQALLHTLDGIPITPDEVREFGRRFHEICTWARQHNRDRPTLNEIEGHVGKVRAKRITNKPQPKRREETDSNDKPLSVEEYIQARNANQKTEH